MQCRSFELHNESLADRKFFHRAEILSSQTAQLDPVNSICFLLFQLQILYVSVYSIDIYTTYKVIPSKSRAHLAPYRLTRILFTVFLMLYLTSQWLFRTSNFYFLIPSNFLLIAPPHLSNTILFSVSMSFFLFYLFVLFLGGIQHIRAIIWFLSLIYFTEFNNNNEILLYATPLEFLVQK